MRDPPPPPGLVEDILPPSPSTLAAVWCYPLPPLPLVQRALCLSLVGGHEGVAAALNTSHMRSEPFTIAYPGGVDMQVGGGGGQ